MSLWTPDGERPIPPRQADDAGSEPPSGPGPEGDESGPELTPEQEEQAEAMARELSEARARLLETPVATVLANHALGIYELAAIHLTSDEPDLAEAQLAIDALTALVQGVEGRLGDGEPTLKEALHQAQMAFVQRAQQVSAPAGDD